MIFYITKTTKYMSIEEAMMGGIVFKGKKDKPKEENKIKTKAKNSLIACRQGPDGRSHSRLL